VLLLLLLSVVVAGTNQLRPPPTPNLIPNLIHLEEESPAREGPTGSERVRRRTTQCHCQHEVSTECHGQWHGKFHGGKDGRVLMGEAVEGAEDTESTPARRGRGGMKTVAGAAGNAAAGEGEASAAAKAAAALCKAGAEARVRSPGAERQMLAAGAAWRGRRAGEGACWKEAEEAQQIDRCRRGRAPARGGLRGEAQKIGGCWLVGGCPGSPEQQRRGQGSGRTKRSARWKGSERSGSTSGPRRSAARARRTAPRPARGGPGEMCGRGRARECHCWRERQNRISEL
jgi:hypothetical protein